jgi:cysteine synthase
MLERLGALAAIGALAVARRLGPGARAATFQVDSGMKYLGGSLYA